MNTDADCWDTDYKQRGQLWGGAVHHLLGIPPDSQVLELGCGNGKTLTKLVNRGVDVTAVDFSFCAASLSRQVAQHAGTGDVAVADARTLPFSSGSFNDIIAFHVIGHAYENDRVQIAREILRLLSNKGLLWFSEFSTEDMRSDVGTMVEPQTCKRGTGICTHYFTEPEVKSLFWGLSLVNMTTRRWAMRVRGKDHIRAEVVAVFEKREKPV